MLALMLWASSSIDDIVFHAFSGLESEEGKNMAIECLQLVTLLLPPELRRKLHLLLRFMSKVAANGKLRLDDDVPTKTLVRFSISLSFDFLFSITSL